MDSPLVFLCLSVETACIGPCFREPMLLNIFHLARLAHPLLASYWPLMGLPVAKPNSRFGISFLTSKTVLPARSARVPLISPCSRRRMGRSPSVHACVAGIVPAPQGACSRSARPCDRPCALLCDGGHWSDRNRAIQIRRRGSGTAAGVPALARRQSGANRRAAAAASSTGAALFRRRW